MNKEERTRLKRIQENAKNGKYGDDSSTHISAFDLHLLLSADITTRKLILNIIKDALSMSQNNAGTVVQEPTVAAAEGVIFNLRVALAQAQEENTLLRQNLTQEQTQRQEQETQLAVANKELQKLQEQQQQLQKKRNELESKLKAVPPPDTLREQLKPEMALLKAVKADAELAQVWLHSGEVSNENEARQLVRLVSVMGDWDELQTLWSRLADRCKSDKRPLTANEQTVLQTALDFHNLRYRDRTAQLVSVPVGSAFHHETMERGTSQGSTVRAVWLPGLKNAAGKLQKQALVQTSA